MTEEFKDTGNATVMTAERKAEIREYADLLQHEGVVIDECLDALDAAEERIAKLEDERDLYLAALKDAACIKYRNQRGPSSTLTTASGDVEMVWVGELGFSMTYIDDILTATLEKP